MRAHHVNVEHHFAKPPERIFAYLSEHENLSEMFGAKVTRLRDGDTERNGVGSVRKLQIGPAPPFVEAKVREGGRQIEECRKRVLRLRNPGNRFHADRVHDE